MKTLILAGGLGTRLREVVNDTPKPLAPVNNIPYLAYVLNALYQQGVRDVILLVGYRAEQFDHFIALQQAALPDLTLTLVIEPEPLGTGGAVKHCYRLFPDDTYLIFNGDSYCHFSLPELLAANQQKGAAMVVAEVPNISRYGEVSLFSNGKVNAFHEKKPVCQPGWINAGIYYLPTDILKTLDVGASFSFEKEIIPQLLKQGIYSVKAQGEFIDIGIPDDYYAMCQTPQKYFSTLPLWPEHEAKP